MEIKDLQFRYEKNSPLIIDGLNLTIEPGMFLTILGENGSAKSTLIRLLLGLLSPVGGSIRNSFKEIGYVPQKKDKFNMHFPISVQELMAIHMDQKKGNREGTDYYLSQLEMKDYAKRRFGDLSGGQQQRVLIARAISGKPDLLILDEPLTGIDSHSRNVIHNLLLDLNRQGLTIISIDHDIAFALHHSSHILTLKDGNYCFYKAEDYRQKIGHEDLDNLRYHQEVSHV